MSSGGDRVKVNAIDRDSPMPFYVQLKDALRAQIEAGYWQVGDRIPGEPELCRMFEVSRTVVRQALKEMVYEGLIVREKGRGTFIAEPRISSKSLVHSLAGFYEDMVEKGITPVAKVLEQAIEPVSQKMAAQLQLDAMEPVIKIKRLRFVEDEPMVLVTSYVPYALCQRLIHADLSLRSLYAFLEEECGLTIARGRRLIDAVVADEYEAELLQIEQGAPLLRLESVSYASDGVPVEYFLALFRSDRTHFEVELARIHDYGLPSSEAGASNARVLS
jgi:GntR family transcriptional regulator